MKLFKNVDICDLESILAKGILSMSESGNNNWNPKKRANNPTDVVYLFSPIGHQNSFPKYGAALLEVEVEDAVKSNMHQNDWNVGRYEEYVIKKVEPSNIKAIYIPSIFKGKDELPDEVRARVTYCGITAKVFDLEHDCLVDATAKDFACLAERGEFVSTTCINFFRGVRENNTVIDFENVRYEIN